VQLAARGALSAKGSLIVAPAALTHCGFSSARQLAQLIVMDITMPHMNGIEALKRFARSAATCPYC